MFLPDHGLTCPLLCSLTYSFSLEPIAEFLAVLSSSLFLKLIRPFARSDSTLLPISCLDSPNQEETSAQQSRCHHYARQVAGINSENACLECAAPLITCEWAPIQWGVLLHWASQNCGGRRQSACQCPAGCVTPSPASFATQATRWHCSCSVLLTPCLGRLCSILCLDDEAHYHHSGASGFRLPSFWPCIGGRVCQWR